MLLWRSSARARKGPSAGREPFSVLAVADIAGPVVEGPAAAAVGTDDGTSVDAAAACAEGRAWEAQVREIAMKWGRVLTSDFMCCPAPQPQISHLTPGWATFPDSSACWQ